jgi:hypothetical protein
MNVKVVLFGSMVKPAGEEGKRRGRWGGEHDPSIMMYYKCIQISDLPSW